jgi:hypothetical protein
MPVIRLGKLLFLTLKSEDHQFQLALPNGKYAECGVFERDIALEPSCLCLKSASKMPANVTSI